MPERHVTLARKVVAPPGENLKRKNPIVNCYTRNVRNLSRLDFPGKYMKFLASDFFLEIDPTIFSYRSIRSNFGVGEIFENTVLFASIYNQIIPKYLSPLAPPEFEIEGGISSSFFG